MNSSRAFWMSGLATLAVLLLLGGALLTRAQPRPTSTTGEVEVLRAELERAYADLDQAYRTIEQLRGRRHHEEDDDD